jgi:hypothetical protein
MHSKSKTFTLAILLFSHKSIRTKHIFVEVFNRQLGALDTIMGTQTKTQI